MPNIFLGLALQSISMLNSKFQSPANSFVSVSCIPLSCFSAHAFLQIIYAQTTFTEGGESLPFQC